MMTMHRRRIASERRWAQPDPRAFIFLPTGFQQRISPLKIRLVPWDRRWPFESAGIACSLGTVAFWDFRIRFIRKAKRAVNIIRTVTLKVLLILSLVGLPLFLITARSFARKRVMLPRPQR